MSVVIFDMDGTILNTIDDITGAVNYILGKYNLPLRSVDEVKSFVGNGLHRTLELSVSDEMTAEFVDKIFDEFVSYYKEHSNIATKPYEGIVDILKKLKKKGYQLAVVSNKRQEAVSALCDAFYTGLFDENIGDQEGIARKPAPDMVKLVLKRLDAQAEDTVYVGDSDVDIMTAQNAGLNGIFVSWGFRTREFLEEHGAGQIVDTTQELMEQIEKVSKNKL